ALLAVVVLPRLVELQRGEEQEGGHGLGWPSYALAALAAGLVLLLPPRPLGSATLDAQGLGSGGASAAAQSGGVSTASPLDDTKEWTRFEWSTDRLVETVSASWRAFLAASLGLATLTTLVIVRGDQPELRPIETSPVADDPAVSTRPLITLRFRGRLDPAGVADHFRLSPPIDGTLEVDNNLIRFSPRAALEPGVRYEARLTAGVREQSGREARQDFVLPFQTRLPRLLI